MNPLFSLKNNQAGVKARLFFINEDMFNDLLSIILFHFYFYFFIKSGYIKILLWK